MRVRASICRLLILLAAGLFVAGCPAPRGTVGEQKSRSNESAPEQRFDPLELPLDREVVPQEYPQTGALAGQVVFADTDSTELDSSLIQVIDLPDDIDSVFSQAYRVQLLTTKVYGESRHALKIAEEIFDRPVSVDYEVPYFKVRVGSFSDRDKAEEYSMRAKAAGYKNAWVVMVNINPKQTSPMYDDEMPFFEADDSIFYDSDAESDDGSESN